MAKANIGRGKASYLKMDSVNKEKVPEYTRQYTPKLKQWYSIQKKPGIETKSLANKTNTWGHTKDHCDQPKTGLGECKRIQMEVAQRINTPKITQHSNPLIEPVYPEN